MDLIHPHKSDLGPGNFLPKRDGVPAACAGLAASRGTSLPVSHSVRAPLFCLSVCAMWCPANLTTASLPIEDGPFVLQDKRGSCRPAAPQLLVTPCRDRWPCGTSASYRS